MCKIKFTFTFTFTFTLLKIAGQGKCEDGRDDGDDGSRRRTVSNGHIFALYPLKMSIENEH
jgi:hypothetical protein